MSNLRIIYDNAADRATVGASTTAGTLDVVNLKTDMKSEVWRSTSTSSYLVVDWPSAEMVGGLALINCNLSPAATLRVRGYTNPGDVTPVFDRIGVLPVPGAPLGMWTWGTVPLGANAYSYVGGAIGRDWFGTTYSVRRILIEISDPTNPSGYNEVSRLLIGRYWQAQTNPDYGASVSPVDTSKNYRNDAGDLTGDVGTKHNKLSFSLSKMLPADRNAMWDILRGNGLSRPFFISLFPEAADTSQEQIHQIYGRLAANPAMALPSFNLAAAQLEIEGN